MVFLSLVAALVVFAPPASAQTVESCAIDITDYEGSASVSIDNLQPQAGDTVTFVGTGFPPGLSVPLAVNGETIGAPVSDSEGDFTFSYTIPADLAPGTQLTFSATCGAFVLTQVVTITATGVTPTTVAPGGQPLPVTGSDSGWLLRAGLALIVAGGLVVLAVRRRDEATAAA
jgi:LPXTG-motif cell wall-anchored protein